MSQNSTTCALHSNGRLGPRVMAASELNSQVTVFAVGMNSRSSQNVLDGARPQLPSKETKPIPPLRDVFVLLERRTARTAISQVSHSRNRPSQFFVPLTTSLVLAKRLP